MKFCFNCGTQLLEDDQKFCINCGAKLKEEDPDLESGNTDNDPQITNYYDYFDNAVDDESKSIENESVFLSVDMEGNTFLKMEEGFDDKDMDKVFNHLKAKAHEHDEYQSHLIYEENKKREEYYSYDPEENRQRILDAAESEEDREPISVLDFKDAPIHPFATTEIYSDGNLVFKPAFGTIEYEEWLERERERQKWKETLKEHEKKRKRKME